MKITKKAFTLIELMIVVVILWVLMSTVLPKLTWAQARSRDAWRIADIWNIAAALQVYYDDNGQFPWSWSICLWESLWVAAKINWYMQSEKVPTDPQSSANQHLCWTNVGNDTWLWKYFYAPIVKNWLNNNAYTLCADMETLQKANTTWSLVTAAATWWDNWVLVANHDYDDLKTVIWAADDMTTEPNNEAWESVYCIIRP
jgi:prepilin-type N-terminal cleavage/methylation domain-containing protein